MAKQQKYAALREMGEAELRVKLDETRQKLFKLRVSKAGRQLNDTSGLRQSRRDIARLMTALAAKPAGARQTQTEKA